MNDQSLRRTTRASVLPPRRGSTLLDRWIRSSHDLTPRACDLSQSSIVGFHQLRGQTFSSGWFVCNKKNLHVKVGVDKRNELEFFETLHDDAPERLCVQLSRENPAGHSGGDGKHFNRHEDDASRTLSAPPNTFSCKHYYRWEGKDLAYLSDFSRWFSKRSFAVCTAGHLRACWLDGRFGDDGNIVAQVCEHKLFLLVD